MSIPLAKQFIPSIVNEFENLIRVSPQLASVSVIDLVIPWKSLGNNKQFPFVFTPNGERDIVLAVVLSKDQNSPGNFLNYFSEEERFAARGSNVLEYYKSNLQNLNRPPLEIYGLLYVTSEIKQVQPMKPALAYAIYSYFNSKVVFDFNIEFGSRIVGAALANVEVYHGINQQGYKYAERLIDFLKSQSSRYNNFAVTEAGTVPNENSYDTVFATVPQIEDFVPDFSSATKEKRREIEKEWGDNYLFRTMLRSCYGALVKEGHLLLYYTSPKYMSPIHDYLSSQGFLKMRFLGIIGVTREDDLNNANAIFVYRKT
jgi:hypothetical protein